MYKVGDKVRIKREIPKDKRIMPPSFTDEMEKYMGRTVQIKEVIKTRFGKEIYIIEDIDGTHRDKLRNEWFTFRWIDEWLEEIDANKINETW